MSRTTVTLWECDCCGNEITVSGNDSSFIPPRWRVANAHCEYEAVTFDLCQLCVTRAVNQFAEARLADINPGG